jgi:hypothetical protein
MTAAGASEKRAGTTAPAGAVRAARAGASGSVPAALGALVGRAPHQLHHVGSLGGAALVGGAAGGARRARFAPAGLRHRVWPAWREETAGVDCRPGGGGG